MIVIFHTPVLPTASSYIIACVTLSVWLYVCMSVWLPVRISNLLYCVPTMGNSYSLHQTFISWNVWRSCFQIQRSNVKITQVDGSACLVRSIAPLLHDGFVRNLAQIQPVRWRCITHNLQVKRSMVNVTKVVWIFHWCLLRGSVNVC